MTGQKAAYDYLGGSIEKFPSGDGMIRLIAENGLALAAAQPLTGGIATIYTAGKRNGFPPYGAAVSNRRICWVGGLKTAAT